MRTLIAALSFIALACTTQTALLAQDLPGASQTTDEHKWLQRFVGEWEVASEGSAGPDQPPIKGTAVMKSTMLGELWLINSSDNEVAGIQMKSIQMIGYDTNKEKYVGIWADSYINHMWHYEGDVDESGNKLTLNAEGPSMTGGDEMVNYRDVYEFTDDDTIVATSLMQDADGNWTEIMRGSAKRRK